MFGLEVGFGKGPDLFGIGKVHVWIRDRLCLEREQVVSGKGADLFGKRPDLSGLGSDVFGIGTDRGWNGAVVLGLETECLEWDRLCLE